MRYFIFILIILGFADNSYCSENYIYNQNYNLITIQFENTISDISLGYDSVGNRISYQSSGFSLANIQLVDSDNFSFFIDRIQVDFICLDDKFGNVSYEFAIGTAVGGTDVLNWTPYAVDPNCSTILSGLSLISGQAYYVSIRVKNFADDIVSDVATTNPITVYDPTSDEDGDSFDNQSELVAESDPFNINSFPGLTQINLVPGFNLISIPADTSKKPDLLEWLPVVGSSVEVSKVMVKGEGETVYSSFIPEDNSSPNYNLYGDEGLLVYANEQKIVTFNSILCQPHNLKAGLNFIGFSCVPEGYTAYQLLNALGYDDVSSIQRYSTDKGSFETAAFRDLDEPAGIDFQIKRGEGYYIYMKVDYGAFSP